MANLSSFVTQTIFVLRYAAKVLVLFGQNIKVAQLSSLKVSCLNPNSVSQRLRLVCYY